MGLLLAASCPPRFLVPFALHQALRRRRSSSLRGAWPSQRVITESPSRFSSTEGIWKTSKKSPSAAPPSVFHLPLGQAMVDFPLGAFAELAVLLAENLQDHPDVLRFAGVGLAQVKATL
ncbi:MAG: hypothetical protein ACYS1C_01385 [Planctomycetota bacterium]|jgi:hypothetical protein